METVFSTTLDLPSDRATTALAEALAPMLGAGDTLLLSGPVGAGKSHFARALIKARLRAADRDEDVPSPTYTLVQTYWDGITEIWHADLYRLGSVDDLIELGLETAFEDAVVLVEWPDRMGALRPKGALSVDLTVTEGGKARRATLAGDRSHWERRVTDAAGVLGHV